LLEVVIRTHRSQTLGPCRKAFQTKNTSIESDVLKNQKCLNVVLASVKWPQLSSLAICAVMALDASWCQVQGNNMDFQRNTHS
jgi:hypothetical protein